MSGLTTAGKNNAVAGITAVVTHIGLVDAGGTELTGGTYARVAVGSWGAAGAPAAGEQLLGADLSFNVPAGKTVGGWRGYTALTDGTDQGGGDVTNEAYAAAGTYVLDHTATGYQVS
jgi:hypothetical protein